MSQVVGLGHDRVQVPELEDRERRDGVITGRIGHVGVVLLDRAEKANAFDRAMQAALAPALEGFDAAPEIRAITIGSTSRKHFSAGVDLNEATELDTPAPPGPPRLTNRQLGVETPVVCAVEGAAVGGGLHFVLDAEIVVAGRDATFVDPHVSVGFVSGVESVGLAEKIGLGNAFYLALTGRTAALSAERAYQLGLVQEIVEAGQALARALELAAAIASNSPSAVRGTADTIRAYASSGYPAAIEYGLARVREQWLHPDSVEGPRAFRERRAPVWSQAQPNGAAHQRKGRS
jgi:enoyl-CoA hydratase/carnithine racemase